MLALFLWSNCLENLLDFCFAERKIIVFRERRKHFRLFRNHQKFEAVENLLSSFKNSIHQREIRLATINIWTVSFMPYIFQRFHIYFYAIPLYGYMTGLWIFDTNLGELDKTCMPALNNESTTWLGYACTDLLSIW